MGTPRVEDAMMWEAGESYYREDLRQAVKDYLSAASGAKTFKELIMYFEKANDSFVKFCDGDIDYSLLDDETELILRDVIHQLIYVINSAEYGNNTRKLLFSRDAAKTVKCACGNPLEPITLHDGAIGYRPCKYCYHEAMKNEVDEAEKKAFEAGLNKGGGK